MEIHLLNRLKCPILVSSSYKSVNELPKVLLSITKSKPKEMELEP